MSERFADIDELMTAAVILPGGYRDSDGRLHREMFIRPITGREEEWLAGRTNSLPIPVLVTHLISRCALRLGPYTPVTPEMARCLLVADRDYLLLALRQLTFGNHVQAVLVCTACGEKMDLDFDIDQISVERRTPPAPGAVFELSPTATYRDMAGQEHSTIEFRLPTGSDQETITSFSPADTEGALKSLLARCVIRLGTIQPVAEATIGSLGLLAREEIEARMESVAPLVELDMDIRCPQCGHVFIQYFDFAAFLMEEIKQRRSQLYREVHTLALHYHWSEAEILALTRPKRRTYLELLYEAQTATPVLES